MSYLLGISLFVSKFILVIVFIFLALVLGNKFSKLKKTSVNLGFFKFINLNELYKMRRYQLLVNSKKTEQAKKLKNQLKRRKKSNFESVLYILDFKGDVAASQVWKLREEITTIINGAPENSEVLLRLSSGGGVVSSYGLAAAQLMRLKKSNIKLTVAVDEIAASGGYMMACVADKIIASNFAIIGSIGVVTQLPNFNKLLNKHNIDFEQVTSGEFKRTLTLFGKNTDEGRLKLQEDLDDVHKQFSVHVKKHRPNVEINNIANGDDWSAELAKDLNLVDEISTSDEFILKKINEDILVISVDYEKVKSRSNKLGLALASIFKDKILDLTNMLKTYSRKF